MQVVNSIMLEERIFPFIKKIIRLPALLGNGLLFPDFHYKWHFIKDYMPELYRKHTSANYANCLFCSNLVRTKCHRHCFKCGIGTYIKCGPPLPGEIYKEPAHINDSGGISIPWFYMKPCSHFTRLPQYLYFKNLRPLSSPFGIFNMEILEGLEKGLSAGARPCHVCASTDYELYKKCAGQENYCVEAPCRNIVSELRLFYYNQAGIRLPAGMKRPADALPAEPRRHSV